MAGGESGSAGAGVGGSAGAGGTGNTHMLVVAANLTSGTAQSYDLGHGIRILQGLKPDIALVQEFNYRTNSPSDIQEFVATTFGKDLGHVREDGQIPNGVVSRYPILESGEWDDPMVSNRDFVWARIDTPGLEEVWAVSVHFLTANSEVRGKEVNALLGFIQARIPAGDLLVLGGDFNTKERSEECVTALASLFVTDGPYPVDQNENGNTNASRGSPYDWVLVSPGIDDHEVPVRIGSRSFPHGLVFDSRVYTPLDEVPPVLLDDSGAPQMQHMAVVRDFVIP